MVLVLDSSTPPYAVGSNNPWVTASFTPPVGSLLVVVVTGDWFGGTPTIGVTSSGLTFVSQIKAGATNNGVIEIFTSDVGAAGGTARTVSVTTTLTNDTGGAKVYVLTGQHATFVDTTGSGGPNATNNWTPNVLATNFDGCWVFSGAVNWVGGNLASTSTDVFEEFNDLDLSIMCVRKSTTTASAGVVSMNYDQVASGSPTWSFGAISIRAADGAAPAAPAGLWVPQLRGIILPTNPLYFPFQDAQWTGDSATGPTNFLQSLNADLSFTSTDSFATSKTVAAATLAFVGSITKRTATLRAAAVSFTGSIATLAAHLFLQALSATLSFTSSQTRQIGTSLAGALSFTSSQSRRTSKSVPAGLSFTGAVTKRIATVRTAAVSFTSSQTRRTAKGLAGGLSFTGSIATLAVHVFTQALNATLSFTSSQSRQVGARLAGAVSFTSNQSRLISKTVAAGLSFTGAVTRRTATTRSAVVSFTSSQTRRTVKGLAGAVSFTGNLATLAVHFFTQALTASLSFTGSLATNRTIAKALTATLSFTGSQTKRAGKSLAAGVSFTGSQTRRIAKLISASVGLTGLFTRLSSLIATFGTAHAAQMTTPETKPGSASESSASPATGSAPTSTGGTSQGPTSTSP